MAKKAKAHVVAQGHQTGVFTEWSDVEKQTFNYSGKLNWGCPSVEQAEAEYQKLCEWRSLYDKDNQAVLTLNAAKKIVAGEYVDPKPFIKLLEVERDGLVNDGVGQTKVMSKSQSRKLATADRRVRATMHYEITGRVFKK
ncbi:ribonuclease H1 domain-containing protein [Vibrio sp. FJH11]